jgi:polygalacturonase
MVCVGKSGARGILWSIALLGSCGLSLEASARPRHQGCAGPPASSLIVNVTDTGASGDDAIEDTAAIQAAIDAVAGTGGTVHVPDGTYLVDAAGKGRLRLRSDMTLDLAPGAVLKAVPNDARGYALLSISGASNVTVAGGTLEGERHEHAGTSGEWGMGIRIDGGAENVTISGVTARNMWGDGFYVESARAVMLCAVVADSNRRQGLSIIEVDGLVVTGSIFKNTWGTRPSSGIDLEPDNAAQAIRDIRIQNSEFLDNVGAGLLIDGGKGPISNVEVTNNVFAGNPRSIKLKHAPGVSASCGNQLVSQSGSWSDISALVEAIKFTVVRNDCDD